MAEDEVGELSHALQQESSNTPVVKETRDRRAKMRVYFRDECKRLGLTEEVFEPDRSNRVTGAEIADEDLPDFNNQVGVVDSETYRVDFDMNRRVTGNEVRAVSYTGDLNQLDYDAAEARGLNVEEMRARVLGERLIARYNGYFVQESNARARAPGEAVEFNERFLDMPIEEMQRVVSHELQHVKTYTDAVRWQEEQKGRSSEELYLWTFHGEFDDVYERISAHYLTQKVGGYPFGKEVRRPNWETKGDPGNYADYNELLSLLRGYEVYLRQAKNLKEKGLGEDEVFNRLKTQPYEFIEAFREEDLQFLDPEYRHQLAGEVVSTNPDIAQKIEKDKEVEDIGEIVLD